MATQDEHSFDRRASDVNVQALALRMTGMETRIETVELATKSNTEELARATTALSANTDMTREVHEAVFGVKDEFAGLAEMTRDVHGAVFGTAGKPGVQDTVKDIYELVEMGKGFFGGLKRWSGRVGMASDWISKTLRRFWWLIALGAATVTYVKTGKWELPLWPG